MATFEEIKEVRLRISDPFGVINLIEVANKAALPTDPAPQTNYKTADTGYYWETTKTTGATDSDYTIVELQVSDDRIEGWIDSDGVDYATCQGLKQITTQIGKEYGIKKNTAGSDSTEWQALGDLYGYYKDLLKGCTESYEKGKGNSSSRWGGSKAFEVAGGNL